MFRGNGGGRGLPRSLSAVPMDPWQWLILYPVASAGSWSGPASHIPPVLEGTRAALHSPCHQYSSRRTLCTTLGKQLCRVRR